MLTITAIREALANLDKGVVAEIPVNPTVYPAHAVEAAVAQCGGRGIQRVDREGMTFVLVLPSSPASRQVLREFFRLVLELSLANSRS